MPSRTTYEAAELERSALDASKRPDVILLSRDRIARYLKPPEDTAFPLELLRGTTVPPAEIDLRSAAALGDGGVSRLRPAPVGTARRTPCAPARRGTASTSRHVLRVAAVARPRGRHRASVRRLPRRRPRRHPARRRPGPGPRPRRGDRPAAHPPQLMRTVANTILGPLDLPRARRDERHSARRADGAPVLRARTCPCPRITLPVRVLASCGDAVLWSWRGWPGSAPCWS